MWLPDPRFEAPELFEPGRKPVGDFVINTTDPLAPDELCVDLYNEIDLISGRKLTTSDPIEQIIVKGKPGRHFDDPTNSQQEKYLLPIAIDHHVAGDRWSVTWYGNKTGDTNDGVFIGVAGTSTNYIWMRHSNTIGVNASGLRVATITGGETYTLPKWYTLVFNGDSTYQLYRNGVLAATSSAQTGIEALSITHIGATYSSAGFSFDGNLTDVYIHSWRLTAGQIKELHSHPYRFLIPK